MTQNMSLLSKAEGFRNLDLDICGGALNQASRSNLGSFNTGAVIFNSKTLDIIGKGCSHYADWSVLPTVHAEEHALKNSYLRKYQSYSIFIVCVGRAGNLTYSSRPCISCAKRLKKANIEYVYYPEKFNNGKLVINIDTPKSLLKRVTENRDRMEYARDMRI